MYFVKTSNEMEVSTILKIIAEISVHQTLKNIEINIFFPMGRVLKIFGERKYIFLCLKNEQVDFVELNK